MPSVLSLGFLAISVFVRISCRKWEIPYRNSTNLVFLCLKTKMNEMLMADECHMMSSVTFALILFHILSVEAWCFLFMPLFVIVGLVVCCQRCFLYLSHTVDNLNRLMFLLFTCIAEFIEFRVRFRIETNRIDWFYLYTLRQENRIMKCLNKQHKDEAFVNWMGWVEVRTWSYPVLMVMCV